MSLDKTGFDLIETEYQRIKSEIENKLHTKYAQRDMKVSYSVDIEERKNQQSVQKAKTDREMSVELEIELKVAEERLFVDYNGSRDKAFKMAHDFSHLPDEGLSKEFDEKAKDKDPDKEH